MAFAAACRALVRACVALATACVLLLGLSADAIARPGGGGYVSTALDNGEIKVGVDLNAGGAISYLSLSGSSHNLINVRDKGRYVQQSYYAGVDIDRSSEGQHPRWSPWSWNPIQGGDAYGSSPPISAWSNDGRTIYVRTQPLLWDMYRELCQCYFETWIALEGRKVRVRNKLTSFRTDSRWSLTARLQELPAVYAIADLHRVTTYTGAQPFTYGGMHQVADTPAFWERWNATERWAACVNSDNFGVGVYNPPRTLFTGGLYGSPGGGPSDIATCYLSPREEARLGKKTGYGYRYYLIVGGAARIREEVYELERRLEAGWANQQSWHFNWDDDFENWKVVPTVDVSVQSGLLNGNATTDDPIVVSPLIGKKASSLKKVVVRLRNNTASNRAQLYFKTLASDYWSGSKGKTVTIQPHSPFTDYTFDMSGVPEWTGTITKLRLDPIDTKGSFRIDWITIR